MIVKDINTVKESIGINAGFNYDDIKPYLKRAERKFLIKLIGQDQYDVFNAGTPPTGNALDALKLAQDAVSNLAYYLGLPVLSVQVSSSGFFVPENDNTKPITDKQFKELQRSFKSSGLEAIDEMLDFMESNKSDFDKWTSDASYTEFKELLVYNTATFQKEYNINNSRLTFLALVPNIKIVEDQFIKGTVQDELFTALKDDQTNDLRKQVKEFLIKSIVAYTIYKTMGNGMFRIETDGIYLRFDVLPYEKSTAYIQSGKNDFITNTKNAKLDEAEEYLKKALEIIQNPDNADDFTEYTAPDSEITVDKVDFVKTKGIVGI